jgi:hypothetical protein
MRPLFGECLAYVLQLSAMLEEKLKEKLVSWQLNGLSGAMTTEIDENYTSLMPSILFSVDCIYECIRNILDSRCSLNFTQLATLEFSNDTNNVTMSVFMRSLSNVRIKLIFYHPKKASAYRKLVIRKLDEDGSATKDVRVLGFAWILEASENQSLMV